jgi:hypothetical protein
MHMRMQPTRIGDEGSDGERGDGTDTVQRSKETESVSLRVAEVILPWLENAHVVQHGSIDC